ncbi:D-alanyl-D-alanine carboxypeptidase family protein [Marinicellulosiphila megalodicopiae]|uniref:D-alanyl-D-alanine carboxypeptidase family protein n=1 Tax=Marinicellulosiphila megalodicopiae TaxID=2724896 RepID=UPI003BB1F706
MSFLLSRFAVLCLVVFSGFVSAQVPLLPAPPQLAASSYVLMDANTGEILVQNNPDERLPPASLTKMMTAYIAEVQLKSGNLSMSDEVLISEKAWRKQGSKMWVEVGTNVLVEDLMRGIIIQSGNDASIAMAEHIAGDEDVFAQLMNQYASKLGMNNTQFKNSTGWPAEGHYSTAMDLALLARAIIYHDPALYKIYSEESFEYGGIKQPNRNSLLRDDPSVDGLKTGHTEEAGYCLVSSAIKEDTRFIAVVMGTKSTAARASESKKLLNYGFSFFESATLVSANESLHTARVWKGLASSIDIGLLEPINKTIQKNTRDLHDIQIEIDPTLEAPIAKGDVLGKLVITLEGEIVHEQVVVALNDVEQAGFFARLWDAISLFFFNLFN